MSELRVGVVGIGGVGAIHATVLSSLAGVRLVAVSGGTAGAPAQLGLAGVAHLRPDQVIDHPDIDLVALASPSHLHAEQALAALEAGKHVVVEKPMALTVADAERVVAYAATKGQMVTAIAQRRLEPQHQYLKKLLDAGDLGTPVLGETLVHWYRDDAYYAHAAWRTDQSSGGGSLMNQGVHNVDLLSWLFGPVDEVGARYATLGHAHEAEDTVVATLRFASGALGLVAISTATPPGRPATLSLYTSKGSVELAQADVVRWELTGVPAPPRTSQAPSGASSPLAIGDQGHRAQWVDVVAALRDGRPPVVTGADGAAVVRVMCAIYQAAATGRSVRPDELS